MTDAVATAELYDGPALSQTDRIVNTFTAPSKTFTDIRRSASWWLPFLVICLAGYIFTFAVQSRVGWDQMVDTALHNNPAQYEKLTSSPPEQQAQTRKIMALSFQVSFWCTPVFVLIGAALFALLLWMGTNFIFGGTSTYGQCFAVLMYAGLVTTIQTLLTTMTLYIGDTADNFDISNRIGTNPGYYLGSDAAAWMKMLLGSIDIFTIWYVILIGLGGAMVGRVKKEKMIGLALSVFVLITIVRTAWAAIMS